MMIWIERFLWAVVIVGLAVSVISAVMCWQLSLSIETEMDTLDARMVELKNQMDALDQQMVKVLIEWGIKP